ncbi:hypothetical protein R5R35_006717 [Gryllus longicercus]|uniref:Uncharacterized protein n=1 Tax=Gryllus longicercus TaxID=2509291 RepID=A0AAN9W1H8_9ORTH
MMSTKAKPTPKKGASKLKDNSKSGSSKMRPEMSETSKDSSTSYPLIKVSDNERMLPRYSAVLRRNEEQGVGMDDLNTLQMELESLLSAVALRTRALQDEIQALNTAEGRQDKKGKVSPLVAGKRLKSQERVVKKFKDTAGKGVGESYPSPTSNKGGKKKTVPSAARGSEISDPEISDALSQEAPKVVVPKNDTPNKFWAFVEPYCADITPDDVKLLESLIEENSNDAEYFEIPPLGCHYTVSWSEDDMLEEKSIKSEFSTKKFEKSGESVTAGPLTQRLFSALMEENFLPVDVLCKRNEENRMPQLFKSFTVTNAASFERQVRKELEAHGILDLDELAMDEENDEIFQELKLCQTELKVTTAQNVVTLQRLFKLASEELARQDLKDKLQKADNEVMKIHQKLLIAKKNNEVFSKKDQDLCWKALRDREALLKMLDTLS